MANIFLLCYFIAVISMSYMISCNTYNFAHVLYNYVMYKNNIIYSDFVENESDPILCVDRRDYVNGA